MSYIGSTPTTQSFIAGTDSFNGTGSATNFTLSRFVNSTNDIQVVVNNVVQYPPNYSVSGNTLTISPAPSAGTNNVYVRYLSTTLQSIAPSQGSSIQFGTGSASLPSISFIGDTNTGIYSPAADTIAFVEGGVEAMRIDSSANVGIGTSSPRDVAGYVSLGMNDSTGCLIDFYSASTRVGIVAGDSDATTIGSVTSLPLRFLTNNTERARITSGGQLILRSYGTPTDTDFVFQLFADGTVGGIAVQTNQTGSRTAIRFRNPNGVVGQIETSGSNTSYGTSSDYRLKEDIQPMTGALVKVAALKPCTYKWKADGSNGQGFIAHELAEVVPDAVSGEKDAVDEDGNIKPQSIDVSFLVATLTAAIQEQQAMIDTMKQEIAELKAKVGE
jgi:hypothetical protein